MLNYNMMNLSFDEPAGVLVKTTSVDFPGRIAGSFFLKGCNLRCPYCYNTELVQGKAEGLSSVNDLFSHLEKRKGVISGLVISGGEPLLNPYTKDIIIKAKSLGYKIKIDTNGTLPDKLNLFVNDSELKPDFIAMDLKTSPTKYSKLLGSNTSVVSEKYFFEKITQSIKIISTLPADSREFRTVLVPGLVEKSDIKTMAALLPSDASWQFAQFQGGSCLDKNYNNLIPYTDFEIKEIIDLAKEFIPGATLR